MKRIHQYFTVADSIDKGTISSRTTALGASIAKQQGMLRASLSAKLDSHRLPQSPRALGLLGLTPRQVFSDCRYYKGGGKGLHCVGELPSLSPAAVTCLAFGHDGVHREFGLIAVGSKKGTIVLYKVGRTKLEKKILGGADLSASSTESSSSFSRSSTRNLEEGSDRGGTSTEESGSCHPYQHSQSRGSLESTEAGGPNALADDHNNAHEGNQFEEVLQLHGHSAAITHLTFNDRENRLISSSLDHSLRLWNLQTGLEEKVFTDSTACFAGTFLPLNPRLLVFGNANSRLRVLDSRDGKMVQTTSVGEGQVRSITFDESGKYCYCGCQNGILRVMECDGDTGKLKLKMWSKIANVRRGGCKIRRDGVGIVDDYEALCSEISSYCELLPRFRDEMTFILEIQNSGS